MKRKSKMLRKMVKECTADWDAEKVDLDQMICDIGEKWKSHVS